MGRRVGRAGFAVRAVPRRAAPAVPGCAAPGSVRAVASPAGLAAGVGRPVRGLGGGLGCRGWSGGTIRSFADAVDQRPAGSGLQVVVVGTQRVEFVEPGVPGLRPGFAVVVLGSGPPAALHGAAGIGPGQGDLLSGRWPAAEVSHIEDIHPAGDDQVQNRTPEQLSATDTGTGPTPRISHSSSPATRPRCRACTSTRSNARYRGFSRPASPRRQQVERPGSRGRPRCNLTMLGVPLVGRWVRRVGRRVPSARRRRRPAPARCGRLGGRW